MTSEPITTHPDIRGRSSRSVVRKAVLIAFASTLILGFVYSYASGYWVFVRWYWNDLFHYVKAPLDTPIQLAHQGVALEKDFDVRISCSYPLRISFFPDKKSWQEMETMIAGEAYREGIHLPVDITVEEKQGDAWKTVLHKMVDTNKVSSFIPERFMIRNIDDTYLEKGRYRVTVNVPRDMPEIEGIGSTFTIGGMVSDCKQYENKAQEN